MPTKLCSRLTLLLATVFLFRLATADAAEPEGNDPDAYFATDRLIQVQITMAPEDCPEAVPALQSTRIRQISNKMVFVGFMVNIPPPQDCGLHV